MKNRAVHRLDVLMARVEAAHASLRAHAEQVAAAGSALAAALETERSVDEWLSGVLDALEHTANPDLEAAQEAMRTLRRAVAAREDAERELRAACNRKELERAKFSGAVAQFEAELRRLNDPGEGPAVMPPDPKPATVRPGHGSGDVTRGPPAHRRSWTRRRRGGGR